MVADYAGYLLKMLLASCSLAGGNGIFHHVIKRNIKNAEMLISILSQRPSYHPTVVFPSPASTISSRGSPTTSRLGGRSRSSLHGRSTPVAATIVRSIVALTPSASAPSTTITAT